jgi:hypothetical protein
LVIQFLRVTTAKKVPFCPRLPRKPDNAWERSPLAKYSSIEAEPIRSYKKSGNGKYKLVAHVGAGDLTLK